MQVIGINGQFPGPVMNVTTNWNVVVNIRNNLDEPFLVTWYVQVLFVPLIFHLMVVVNDDDDANFM